MLLPGLFYPPIQLTARYVPDIFRQSNTEVFIAIYIEPTPKCGSAQVKLKLKLR